MSHPDLIDECGGVCAAKQKKSRVQGKCKTCGSPIPAAKRLCPDCRQQEQEEKDNIHAWKTPIGEMVKRQVARADVSAKVVFDIGRLSFPIDSPSGPFLETLIGVCYDRPSYIRANDVARYASLLDSLMHFQSQLQQWEKDSPIVAVRDIPLKKLGSVVRNWIMSFFDEQHHPMLPIYALDAACFIAAHGEGTCLSSDRSLLAVIPPMVESEFSIKCVDDPGFKNDFTQRLFGRQLFIATVPERCSVVGPDRRQWLGPGAKFLFGVIRCFLSRSGYGWVDLATREDDSPDYDISDVTLPGQLWLDVSEDSITDSPARARSGRERQIYVPLGWISHAVRDTGDRTELLPVPQWE